MEFENEIQMWLDAGVITRAQAIKFQLHKEEVERLTQQAREARLWEWGQQPMEV